MLLETKRTCLFQQCPVCGAKMFRYLISGTEQIEGYGQTAALKIRDRCEECKEVFGETDVTLETSGLNERVCQLFTQWEQRTLNDEDFTDGIQKLFVNAGGWITKPSQNTG